MAGAKEKSIIRDAPRKTVQEDSFTEGIIKGLQDFKEGQITRFKDADELADHLRNL